MPSARAVVSAGAPRKCETHGGAGKGLVLGTGWSTGLQRWPEGGTHQRERSLPDLFNPTSIITMSFCTTACLGAGVFSCAGTVQPRSSPVSQIRVPTRQGRMRQSPASLSWSMEGLICWRRPWQFWICCPSLGQDAGPSGEDKAAATAPACRCPAPQPPLSQAAQHASAGQGARRRLSFPHPALATTAPGQGKQILPFWGEDPAVRINIIFMGGTGQSAERGGTSPREAQTLKPEQGAV